jgi:hypothetical protein
VLASGARMNTQTEPQEPAGQLELWLVNPATGAAAADPVLVHGYAADTHVCQDSTARKPSRS